VLGFQRREACLNGSPSLSGTSGQASEPSVELGQKGLVLRNQITTSDRLASFTQHYSSCYFQPVSRLVWLFSIGPVVSRRHFGVPNRS
jgi:hypothetical protein